MTVGVFVGLATLDVVQHVEELPGPNEKVTARWQGVAAGGPALNAAVTFAALGGVARLVTRVGTGPVADLVRADLAACGVELVDVDPGHSPSVSSVTVHVGTGDRQIVSTDGGSAAELSAVTAAMTGAFADADVVEVDGHHPDLAALCLPLAAQLPRVLDAGRWKPQMAWLVPACTDVVCSADFVVPRGDPTGDDGTGDDVLEAVLALGAVEGGVRLAAVSAGAGPLRWRTRDDAGEVTVDAVDVVDTLGAGDVLHGAYAYARAARPTAGPADRLRFAADVASRSCRERGTRSWLRGLRGATLAGPTPTPKPTPEPRRPVVPGPHAGESR